MKKLKRILILPLILLLILLSYVAYVFISYYRIEDNLVKELISILNKLEYKLPEDELKEITDTINKYINEFPKLQEDFETAIKRYEGLGQLNEEVD